MQSRRHSLLESTLNTASGFVVALVVWTYVIIPVFGFHGLSWTHNIEITAIFTVVSIARGFLWRRLFNYFSVRKYANPSDIQQRP